MHVLGISAACTYLAKIILLSTKLPVHLYNWQNICGCSYSYDYSNGPTTIATTLLGDHALECSQVSQIKVILPGNRLYYYYYIPVAIRNFAVMR